LQQQDIASMFDSQGNGDAPFFPRKFSNVTQSKFIALKNILASSAITCSWSFN